MDIGPPEFLIILVVVLLIFGPGRIAKVGRELGESIRQFREGLEKPSEMAEPKAEDKQPGNNAGS